MDTMDTMDTMKEDALGSLPCLSIDQFQKGTDR